MSDPNTGNTNGLQMNSLPPTVASRYVAELAKYNARLLTLDNMLDRLSASGLKSYEFRSGDGQQKGERWSLKEVNDAITYTEGRIRFLEQRVYGRGLMVGRLRRR